MGALALGAVAIGVLAVRRAHFGDVVIDRLTVRRLTIETDDDPARSA